jgi:cell division septation protein DedD
MLPGAALRSAVAVRDLSDSSLIFRLTRGRGWIVLLSVLLFGIVALNVVSLSLNAGSGRVSQAVEELERQNSSLRAQLAEQFSASRIQGTAAVQGLAVPAPEDISYLSAEDGDLERLLKLLNQGTLLTSEPAEITTSSEPVSYLSPVSPEPSPAPSPAPTTAAPAPSAPPPAPSGGGSTGSSGSGGVGL